MRKWQSSSDKDPGLSPYSPGKEFGIPHLSSGGESLGIRNSSGNEEKEENWLRSKKDNIGFVKPLHYYFLRKIWQKLKTRILNEIIVQNLTKICLFKWNCCTKNKEITVPNFRYAKISNSKVLSVDI